MKFAVIALAIIVALGGVYLISRNNPERNVVDNSTQIGIGGGPPTSINTNLDIKLTERAKLHTLLQEHTVLGALHLQKLYNGEDTKDSKEKVLENSEKLSNFFKDSPRFRNVWQNHLNEYEAYTLAIKNGDPESAESAKLHLIMNSEEFGNVMNNIYPSVNAESAAKAMEEHVLLTLSIVDALAKNDNSEKLTQMGKASGQAAKFAETLIP